MAWIAAAGLAVTLVALSTLGLLYAAAAVGVAGFVLLLALFGTEKTGIVVMVAAFFTAPFYKGTAPLGSVVTGTDALLVLGIALLLPQMLRRRLELPLLFQGGVLVVGLAGLIGSVISQRPLESFLALGFWLAVMFLLPSVIILWAPQTRIIDLLAASFVAGQVFSFLAGRARGLADQGRDGGLSSHPNLLAQCAILSLALLVYLGYRYRGRSAVLTGLMLLAGAICGYSLLASGSRAGIVVLSVLILMIPVVERSAVWGFLLAIGGALAVFAFPLVVGASGEGSAFGRLAGDQSSKFSDQARAEGLQFGLDRFRANPLSGDGLIDLYEIHNNFLEVVVGIGIFGLVGYLMVLWALARPIFSGGEHRRLLYCVWGYIGFGATVPSLYDRSVWMAVALGAVAMVERERLIRSSDRNQPAPIDEPRTTTSAAGTRHRHTSRTEVSS